MEGKSIKNNVITIEDVLRIEQEYILYLNIQSKKFQNWPDIVVKKFEKIY